MMHASAILTVTNAEGVHMRPAALITQAVMASGCSVTVRHGEQTADGADVLDLLVLAIPCGATIRIDSTGIGSDALIARLQSMFSSRFNIS